MKEGDFKAHFTKHTKNFTPHSFMNFITGFILMNQEFSIFTQDEVLCVRTFEALLGTYDRSYSVKKDHLHKE